MSEILIALLSLTGTFIGSYSGIRLMSYRIEQLERKVEKHNNVIERMYRLEDRSGHQDDKIRTVEQRLDDLERIDNK